MFEEFNSRLELLKFDETTMMGFNTGLDSSTDHGDYSAQWRSALRRLVRRDVTRLNSESLSKGTRSKQNAISRGG